jgi:hypothetical protein
MTTRTVEQVDEWDSQPFSGGYRGLHDLADERFSGIVTVGPTRLCMTKGNVVGILDGDISAFEGASGTVHDAPSPALPLLAVMQERADEVRAQYYTEETPISEVDKTLSDGNFTGFIELSENVLSGDYYQVYHQGRSMSVAFVGESKQLLTEDEAFERANGEVGIYKVRPVDIDVVEIPEPAGGSTAATAGGAGTEASAEEEPDPDPEPATEAAGAGTESTDTSDETATRESQSETDATADRAADTDTGSAGSSGGDAGRGREADAASQSAEESTGGGRQDRTAEAATGETRERAEEDRSRAQSGNQQSRDQRADRSNRQRGDQGRSRRGQSNRNQSASGGAQSGTEPRGRVFDSHAAQSDDVGRLETRSIPSLDPEQTNEPSNASGAAAGVEADPPQQSDRSPQQGAQDPGTGQQPRDSGRQQRPAESRQQPSEGGRQQPADTGRQQPPAGEQGGGRQPRGEPDRAAGQDEGGDPAADPPAVEELEAEIEERESEIERLEDELETVQDERDDLEEERDELAERVEELEARINDLRTEEGGESIADRKRLGPGEAIDGTNLFIRYGSKGDATLEKAHAGQAEQGAVNDNLDVQHHTQFEADDVAVNGEPFEEFLRDTLQFQFVNWVVRVLPYEIRDTGHEGALKDLYDSLPKIDRAELNGSISVMYEEDGEEHRSQETFDIVLRDRMGNPLAVANLNESRQPASQSKMESLITASSRVGESKESLAGSFLVTSSFFEPEAMEAASAATGGGLLSRDKRESFVKLSRKGGFHLCLVEAREEKFNLSVPEI